MMLGDGSSGVQLEPKWQGPLPPAAVPRILERAACDLFPINPGAPDAEERLLPYIWADQFERLTLTVFQVGRRDRAALDPVGCVLHDSCP